MAKNLVIVESPAKAKTIEGFLGKDFVVKSSYGHIRDLTKGDKAIDIANNFKPVYEISEDKQAVVADLKKMSKNASIVWLATDEDREGEAISWHLFEALGLKESATKRIVFHEITKPAILKAIENPRKIDKNLVDAQQARRILDRLVGFELSPVLWKKVKPSLSAGRVQSVAVRLIVEREREIDNFKIVSSYKIVALFDLTTDKGVKATLKAELPKRFGEKKDAEQFLEKAIGAQFKVKDLETKPGKRSPAAPFTTSTLQQEASRKLGFSVAQTMVVAQRLYESGKITYMRTDSVNMSEMAIAAAKEEITKIYGAQYAETRRYKTKSDSAQEAHEAIRPTYMNIHEVDAENSERRLYDLIWKRTIASQMADAQLERTIVTISSNKHTEELQAQGEVIKFEGFLKVYIESTDDEDEEAKEGLLPPMKIGQQLTLQEMAATQRFSHPPARYTEASLVKKLEELGIGRPSTYAPTISTIQKRGYVIKEERVGRERAFNVLVLKANKVTGTQKTETTGAEKNKLFPTDIGTVVNDFLVQHFKNIMDYGFTAKVEKEFDEIAQGQKIWNKMIKDFYGPFHKEVTNTEENSERATGERVLGKDPVSGKRISVRIGRYGPLVQIGVAENEGDEKPQFASLRAGQRLETITLEEALDLFKLPRNVGKYEEEDVIISIGRFGPYARHKSAFYSLKKEDDPYTITLDRATQIIEDKRKADRERVIKTFKENDEIQVLNGRWGPYIAHGKENAKIPKDKDPKSLTLAECLELLKNKPASKGRFAKKSNIKEEKATTKKKAPAKKTTAKSPAKKTPTKKGTKKASPKKK